MSGRPQEDKRESAVEWEISDWAAVGHIDERSIRKASLQILARIVRVTVQRRRAHILKTLHMLEVRRERFGEEGLDEVFLVAEAAEVSDDDRCLQRLVRHGAVARLVKPPSLLPDFICPLVRPSLAAAADAARRHPLHLGVGERVDTAISPATTQPQRQPQPAATRARPTRTRALCHVESVGEEAQRYPEKGVR